MAIQQNIESLFEKTFSEAILKKFEKYILYLASFGFVLHLLNNYNLIELSIVGTDLFSNPISALYTPFSFILVYEAFLLVYYIPRSFTTAVGKQYQIMSLIVIRKIFKDIPLVDLNANWFENPNKNPPSDTTNAINNDFFVILFFTCKLSC